MSTWMTLIQGHTAFQSYVFDKDIGNKIIWLNSCYFDKNRYKSIKRNNRYLFLLVREGSILGRRIPPNHEFPKCRPYIKSCPCKSWLRHVLIATGRESGAGSRRADRKLRKKQFLWEPIICLSVLRWELSTLPNL